MQPSNEENNDHSKKNWLPAFDPSLGWRKIWWNLLKRVVAIDRCLNAVGLHPREHVKRFGLLHKYGNFIICVKLISEFDPFLVNHIAEYGSPGQGHISIFILVIFYLWEIPQINAS